MTNISLYCTLPRRLSTIKENPTVPQKAKHSRQAPSHFNEISDEAQHEISAAIHASARQSIRPYNSQDEYLFAMKEDLSEWLAILHSESINEYSFFRKLETGILLCKHANTVTLHAEEFQISNPQHPILNQLKVPKHQIRFNEGKHVKSESFFARDNVAQFISWCRGELGISDTIIFETEDLVLRKNEKNFILTLLEVARRGAKFGMEAPTIIKMELEIDREMALDNGEELSSDEEHIYEPEQKQQQQKVAADFKSLDEMVQYYLGQCSCPTMFSLRKVGDGKYQIGDSKALIYMRILRNHVMVRVGGGWDTLENYLNKHDPCRCNRHRVEKHMKSGCINVERRSTGHVINSRTSPSPSLTSRSSSSRSRSTSHEMSRTLPSSFTQRRARPLRDGSDSPSSVTSSGRRSQTPSRHHTRANNHLQSTPKTSKTENGYPRTRRLTTKEPTFKSTRSRESSTERILDDKNQNRNRSRSYEPKTRTKQMTLDPDDIELTLDDLETKIIDDSVVNRQHQQAFQNLSLSFGDRKAKPRQESRPGSSRSRIPIPTSRLPPRPSSAASSLSSNHHVTSRDQHNYSPDRADSGIDIYAEFETSPTNSIRRALRAQQAQYQRPPDIIE